MDVVVFFCSAAGEFSFANLLAKILLNSRLIYLSVSFAIVFAYVIGIFLAYIKHRRMTLLQIDTFDDESRWTGEGRQSKKSKKGDEKEEGGGGDGGGKEEKKEEKKEDKKDKKGDKKK